MAAGTVANYFSCSSIDMVAGTDDSEHKLRNIGIYSFIFGKKYTRGPQSKYREELKVAQSYIIK
ncbi:hypothetical protein QQ020_25785 [Fulvivirgaceae bacterium BMA12]|uniref:Uncharacterized protein n=1 Tax=Agaribacillus aureus TaxID=3051825 RepID=A0ABT8LCK6_9BACT|nr:hypothetical protein [Fulvivirgaceae bacterium BMA12]